MKIHLVPLLLVLGSSLLLTSCPETTIPTDFGVAPLKIKKSDWSGRWVEAGAKDEKDGIVFTVTDESKGRITAQGTDKDDKPLYVMMSSTGGKDERLAFLTYTEKAEETRGPLRLISLAKDNTFVLWDVNHAEIERAIKAGELKGRLVKGDKEDHKHSELDRDPANYAKVLDARFWEWTKPAVFVRRG